MKNKDILKLLGGGGGWGWGENGVHIAMVEPVHFYGDSIIKRPGSLRDDGFIFYSSN